MTPTVWVILYDSYIFTREEANPETVVDKGIYQIGFAFERVKKS